MKQKLFDHIKKKYGASPEYPWKGYPGSAVFRHKENSKWFALVMEVQREKLGLAGAEPVAAVNLKIEDLFFRDMLIQEEGILPAYHMNKLHWVTVLLDGTVPEEKVYDLLDMSYTATAPPNAAQKIYEAVKKIPRGHVATYAQIAELAGNPKMARAVGNALHKNPDPENIPCFRVVNAKGELSGEFAFGGPGAQAKQLEADGVRVTGGRVDLQKYQWRHREKEEKNAEDSDRDRYAE